MLPDMVGIGVGDSVRGSRDLLMIVLLARATTRATTPACVPATLSSAHWIGDLAFSLLFARRVFVLATRYFYIDDCHRNKKMLIDWVVEVVRMLQNSA